MGANFLTFSNRVPLRQNPTIPGALVTDYQGLLHVPAVHSIKISVMRNHK